jgi:hypothetical protein
VTLRAPILLTNLLPVGVAFELGTSLSQHQDSIIKDREASQKHRESVAKASRKHRESIAKSSRKHRESIAKSSRKHRESIAKSRKHRAALGQHHTTPG